MEKLGLVLEKSEKLEPARQRNSEKTIATPGATANQGFRLYSFEDLMSQEFPDNMWLIERLLPEAGITVLSAQPASYKTWLLLDVAKSVASGAALFNHFETEQAGVLMIDEENGVRLLQKRLKMICGDSNVPITFMIDQGFNLDKQQTTKIIKLCNEKNIKLITFDSLVRIHKGDENDAGDMAQVFQQIRRLASAGLSVLITHHNRKNSANRSSLSQEMRGSSDILAAVDCHLALNREDRRLTLTQTKVRLEEELAPVELEIVSEADSLSIKYVGTLQPILSKRTIAEAEIRDRLLEHITLNQKDLFQELQGTEAKVSQYTLRSILQGMVASGELKITSGEKNSKHYSLVKKLKDTPI